MQKMILERKNHITLVIGILIATAFISKLGFGNKGIFLWLLAIASVLGVLPISIQAYQALRVKVISIDLLVTIAVAGAFLIKNFEE
jgi:Cd2+/Zn2+-exporting ATPase